MKSVILSIVVLAVVLGLILIGTDTSDNSQSNAPRAPASSNDDAALGNLK